MRTRRDGDQMRPAAVAPVDGLNKLMQHVLVDIVLAEAHNVNRYFFLFESLGQLDQVLLFGFDRRPDKSDDPGFVVLSLAMLQRQMCDFDSRDELQIAFWLNRVQLGQQLARVCG